MQDSMRWQVRIVDTNSIVKFSTEGFKPQILSVTPDLKIPFICMEDGQMIPPHPGGTGIFYVIEGVALFTVDGEKREVEAGSVIVVPEGAKRGVEAKGRLVAIAFHMS